MRRQRFLLDRFRALSYIGACAAAAACRSHLAALVDSALTPFDPASAVEWSRHTLPEHDMAIRFRFLYEDRRRQWGGRGTARIAPPDSLRFDYVGPLGLGSGAAVVVGDSAVWADPEENFRSLVPAVRMLWAGLGAVRPPSPHAVVSGARTPDRVVWRFAEGADTLDYVAAESGNRVLEAEWRRAGKIVARSRTEFDEHARPSAARILFPEASARFELTVVAVDTAAVFPPSLWRARR